MKMVPVLRRSFRLGLFLGTLVTAVASSQALLVTDAKADSSEKVKVAVGGFDGAKSGDARSAFIEALKKDGGYEVTDAEDIKTSAKGKALAETAAGLGVNVVITGKVGKGGLKLKVLNGADGKLIDEVDVKGAGGKLKGNIEKSGASSVAAAIGQAKGVEEKKKPKEEEPKPDEDKPAEDKPAEEVSVDTSKAGGGKGLSPLDITAGLRPMHRTFEFHDTPYPLLRYELPLGPLLFIDLNWFPGSHFTEGPGEWIGITAGFEKGFATQSIFDEGKATEVTLKTNQQQFYAGGRFRLPIGDHVLGATGTYGQHKFHLAGDDSACNPAAGINEPCPKIPDVNYSYVKVGLDGMFRFGDFMAGARVGKRIVMGTGSLKTIWFPNVKTQSLEAGVTVGYRLVSMLDLVAGFDWLRYGFDFNPVPANRRSYVAGGAVDEYLSGYIAFRFHLPGTGEKAAE